jgi:hypothetical protein
VRVARAVTDGRALDLVLQPGRHGGGRHRLTVERLVPGARYRVTGAVQDGVNADGEGHAAFDVDLDERLVVQFTPEQ